MSPKKTQSKVNDLFQTQQAQQQKLLRNIIETRDVIKTQVESTLIEELLAKNVISVEECKDLTQKVQSVVELQSNNLVDRVQKLL